MSNQSSALSPAQVQSFLEENHIDFTKYNDDEKKKIEDFLLHPTNMIHLTASLKAFYLFPLPPQTITNHYLKPLISYLLGNKILKDDGTDIKNFETEAFKKSKFPTLNFSNKSKNEVNESKFITYFQRLSQKKNSPDVISNELDNIIKNTYIKNIPFLSIACQESLKAIETTTWGKYTKESSWDAIDIYCNDEQLKEKIISLYKSLKHQKKDDIHRDIAHLQSEFDKYLKPSNKPSKTDEDYIQQLKLEFERAENKYINERGCQLLPILKSILKDITPIITHEKNTDLEKTFTAIKAKSWLEIDFDCPYSLQKKIETLHRALDIEEINSITQIAADINESISVIEKSIGHLLELSKKDFFDEEDTQSLSSMSSKNSHLTIDKVSSSTISETLTTSPLTVFVNFLSALFSYFLINYFSTNVETTSEKNEELCLSINDNEIEERNLDVFFNGEEVENTDDILPDIHKLFENENHNLARPITTVLSNETITDTKTLNTDLLIMSGHVEAMWDNDSDEEEDDQNSDSSSLLDEASEYNEIKPENKNEHYSTNAILSVIAKKTRESNHKNSSIMITSSSYNETDSICSDNSEPSSVADLDQYLFFKNNSKELSRKDKVTLRVMAQTRL